MPSCGVVDLWVGLHRNLSGVQSLVGVTGVLLLSSMVLDLATSTVLMCVISKLKQELHT